MWSVDDCVCMRFYGVRIGSDEIWLVPLRTNVTMRC
jgi:hypothetical protein